MKDRQLELSMGILGRNGAAGRICADTEAASGQAEHERDPGEIGGVPKTISSGSQQQREGISFEQPDMTHWDIQQQ